LDNGSNLNQQQQQQQRPVGIAKERHNVVLGHLKTNKVHVQDKLQCKACQAKWAV
jgi:hypothetical protein